MSPARRKQRAGYAAGHLALYVHVVVLIFSGVLQMESTLRFLSLTSLPQAGAEAAAFYRHIYRYFSVSLSVLIVVLVLKCLRYR